MTTREPDRFEAILADWERRFNSPASRRSMFDRADLLAYFRQAESSVLERAAQALAPFINARGEWASLAHPIEIIRALAYPAAAPAADKCAHGNYPPSCRECAMYAARDAAAPAAEPHTLDCYHAGARAAAEGTKDPGCTCPAPPSPPVAPPAITYVNAEQWAAAGQTPLDDKKPREPGCKCHQEEGDSSCPIHGEEEPVAPSLLPRVLAFLDRMEIHGLAAELRRYIAEMEAGTDLRALLSKLVDHMKAWAASEDGRIPAPFVSDFREAQRALSRIAARSEGET